VVLVIVISIIHSNNTYFASIPIQLAVTFVTCNKGNKSFKIPSTSLARKQVFFDILWGKTMNPVSFCKG
jgi:hypothetical protein